MNLPETAAVMTLPGATLFPRAMMPLFIFEPRYRRMLADTLDRHRMFSVAMQKPNKMRENPCTVAGLGLIRASVSHTDGTSHLFLQGLARVELGPAVQTRPYRVHSIRALHPAAADNVETDALTAKVLELVAERISRQNSVAPLGLLGSSDSAGKPAVGPPGAGAIREVIRHLESLPSADQVADAVAAVLLPEGEHRQVILETVPVEQRLRRLIRYLLDDITSRRNLL